MTSKTASSPSAHARARRLPVAVESRSKHEGQSYWQSVEGKLLPVAGTYQMSATSTWHGIVLDKPVTVWLGAGRSAQCLRRAASHGQCSQSPSSNGGRLDIPRRGDGKGQRFLKVRVSAVQTSAFPVGDGSAARDT